MKKIYFLISVLFFLGMGTSNAQYTILHNFNDTAGAHPCGTLTLSGKTLFGMADTGGVNKAGCIFSIDTSGNNYRDIFDFNGTNGLLPSPGFLTISGNKLFGMTYLGGTNDSGRVFAIDTSGLGYKDLLDFTGANGAFPLGSLTLLGNKLYGMTLQGGANNYGCIFLVDSSGGGYKDLFDFNSTTGANPSGELTLIGNKFYGLAGEGGANSFGNVFSVDTNGLGYKDLLDFDGTSSPQGAYPNNLLTLSGNELFGMTFSGGVNQYGNVFALDTTGKNFKDLVDLNNINSPYGEYPFSDVVISGSVLYGMVAVGGVNDSGSIFSIDTTGNVYTDLFDFNGTNGSYPYYTDLTISGNKMYGVAKRGGTYHAGVIFSFNYKAAGINTLTKTSETINLYPNPNNGMFTIHTSAVNDNSIVEVYNVLGEMVYTAPLSQTQTDNTIDISSQPVGMYFVYLKSQQGIEVEKALVAK